MEIEWSERARLDLQNIAEYLTRNWSLDVLFRFESKLDESIQRVIQNPKSFQLAKSQIGLRKIVITKHNTIYYKVNDFKIEIVRLFDTRQNPKKI